MPQQSEALTPLARAYRFLIVDDSLFASASSTELATGFFKATTTLVSARASTASTSPTVVTNDIATGTIAWVDLDNAIISNDTYASTTLAVSEVSNYLAVTGFGFSIPADATIVGIAVDVEKNKDGSGDIQDNAARLVKDSNIGTIDRSSGDSWPTSDATSTYGGFEDLWGETWTADDINSANFGFAISAKETGTDFASAHIDQIRIKVYYHEAIPAGTYRVKIDAQYNNNEAHDNLAFVVGIKTDLPLILYNNTGVSYEAVKCRCSRLWPSSSDTVPVNCRTSSDPSMTRGSPNAPSRTSQCRSSARSRMPIARSSP